MPRASNACWSATRWAWCCQGLHSTVPRDAGRPCAITRDSVGAAAPRAGHRLADRRPAVRQLPGVARTGAAQRRRADAGRRPHGQARRRRLDRRDRALPGRARHPGLRPPGPDAADRCMRWAATACRAGTSDGRGTCSTQHARRCRTRAPRCWCSRWCPPRWPRELTRELTHPHHRHRRRPRLRWPGAGAARHAGHHSSASCRSFVRNFMAERRHRRRRVQAYVAP